MAYRKSPGKAFTLARGLIWRAFAVPALGAALYAGSITAPGHWAEEPWVQSASAASATLSFENGQPIITGSVADLFTSEIFTGPNRSEKTGRARPSVDIASFSQSFDGLRTQVAQLRAAPVREEIPQERIEVASIDPAVAGAEGLRAIDALSGAGDPNLPRPASVPDTLAYARANTPATDFTIGHDFSDREQWCMATGIYFEARGETYRGQVAVAQVIMNRVEHPNYPDTICGVVYQNQHRRNACQFSFACDGTTNVNRTPETAAWRQAQAITQTVLNKEIYLTEVADATHYHATYVNPRWARNMVRMTRIGLHVFYRFRPGWQFG